jgi:hypothetical protein
MKNLKFNQGIIYLVIEGIVTVLFYLNLVELFKAFSGIFLSTNKSSAKYEALSRRSKNIAIDIFILLKWLFVAVVFTQAPTFFRSFVVIYLLLSNIFTYFYYHVWNVAGYSKGNQLRLKRRLLNTFQAILFNIFGYIYLYLVPFKECFKWDGAFSDSMNSVHFSITNTFLGSTNIYALNDLGAFLVLSQYFITFIFIAIILSLAISDNN